jgi:hypothetical protein
MMYLYISDTQYILRLIRVAIIGHSGFQICFYSKKRYKDRNLQGDSKYIEKNMIQNQNLYLALKQFAINAKI